MERGRGGPRLSAVTVRLAQSEIASAGHRVGHRARPRGGRERDARKQGVPEPTPNPGGEQKPIRTREWEAKRRGSESAEPWGRWGRLGHFAEGVSPAGEEG